MLTKINIEKNILLKYAFFLITIFILSNESFAQTGTEFWFAAPDLTSGHCSGGGCPGDEPIYLRFATTDVGADIKVEIPAYNGGAGYVIEEFTMGAQEYYSIDLSSIKSLIETTHPINPPPYETGIHIESTDNISVYYEVEEYYNRDIWALKAENAVGKDFIVPFQSHWDNDLGYNPDPYSAIYIVATKDNTEVEVVLTQPDTDGNAAGVPFTITLPRKGMTYKIEAAGNLGAEHMGGSTLTVTNDGEIAVTVGDDSIIQGGCRDVNGDQIIPTELAGYEYIVMKGPITAANVERAFIFPTVDGTEIFIDGVSIGIYDIDNPATVVITDATHIAGDNPILVYHVTGFSCELGGSILPTIDGCTGSLQVTYYRSNTDPFYLFLMTKKGYEDSFQFHYADGSIFNLPDTWFVEVGTTGWMVLDHANNRDFFDHSPGGGIPEDEATKIVNTEDVFHMGVVNGGNSTTCKYGYFSDFKEGIVSGRVVQSASAIGEVCENNPLQLFASGGLNYLWSPSDYMDDPTSATPYVTLPSGPHSYEVTIDRPCLPDTTIDVFINSIPTPEASFTLSDYSVCAPFELKIYNNSDPTSNQQNWNFDYDNNPYVFDTVTTDPVDTITHWFYNNTNHDTTFNIRLLVRQTSPINPCVDTFFNEIHVKPEIYAGFDQNNLIGCNPLFVDFTDTSSGNLDQYKWSFGDGAQSTEASPDHTYQHVYTNDTIDYEVELVVTSPYFCKDTAQEVVSVFPYLEGGFTIDKDEGCSGYNVRIENVSSGADSIFLDYGDGEIDTLLSFTSINHAYYNNDGVDKVDTNIIVMRVKNNEGCEFISRDTILVYPEIQANFSFDPYNNCNSDTVIFHNNSNNGVHKASRYLWDFADGTGMDTTYTTIEKFYNNTTTRKKDYDFRLTARSVYGCTDDTTGTITMYRAAANFTVDNNEGCSELPVRVTNISVGDEIDIWDWDYGDGIGIDSVENPFQYIYSNPGFENDTNYLVLEVSEALGGCSTKDSIEIVVFPGVRATYTTTLTSVESCDSLVAEFDSDLFHPSLTNIIYEWDFGDGGSSAAADTVRVYRNLLSSSSVQREVKLRVETDMGCSYDTSSFITVYPMVRANISIDQNVGCSPLIVDVSAQSYPGNDSYNWDYGDGSGTSTFQNPPAYSSYPANQSYLREPAGDAKYWLLLEVEDQYNECLDRDSVEITIYSETFADFIPQNAEDCNPFLVNFTDQSAANVDTWKWDFADGTSSSDSIPSNEFENLGSGDEIYGVQLSVTSDRGCTDSISYNVTVFPYVEADFDVDVSEGCSPLTVNITNNSIATEYFWFWDDDDLTLGNADSNSPNPILHEYTYTNGGFRTDYLTLIVGNGEGCYDTLKRPIRIHSSIDASFVFSQPDSCTISLVTFDASGTSPAASAYKWDFGDDTYLTTTSPTVVNRPLENLETDNKDFLVRLTAETDYGCTDTYSDLVTVYSRLVADFSIPQGASCPPFTNALIENTSVGNNLNTYQWFVDGSVTPDFTSTGESPFVRTYDNTDHLSERDYSIRLLATNPHGCTSEYIDTITVYEYVEASFSMDVDEGCTPLNVDFTDLSSVPVNTKYTWDYGDGASSGSTDPDHTYYNPSREESLIRTIELKVESLNGCKDETTQTVEIFNQPLAKFYISKTTSCPPLQATLSNLSEGADFFEWRFDDGNTNSIDNNLLYEWDNTDINFEQTYKLQLWVSTNNNCIDTSNLDLTVFPKVDADFTIDNDAGCSPLENVQFTNTSTSPATRFFWSFGDGTTTNIENPQHNFTNIGISDRIYNIFLQASSAQNCWDTITKPVTVYVQPEAEFYVDPVLLTFPDNVVAFDNKTNTGPFTYLWEFGNLDNSTSEEEEPGSFEYGHWGEKVIQLSATSQTNTECTSTFSDTILIQPPLVNADFITDKDGGCWDGGLEVQFTAASSAYAEEYEYEWDFGDGGTGTGQVTSHIFESTGTYNVQLTAKSTEGAGEDFAYKKIYVYDNPEVSFEVSPTLAMLDASTLEARVKFFNTSLCNDTSGCAYTWDFGDGNTAISKDVTHGYTELGKYDVTLLAVTANGCRDSLTLYEEVEIIGAGEIRFPNAFTPNNSGPEMNETFRPLAEGVIEYELFVYNRWGELIFTTKDLSVGWDGTIGGEMAKPDVYVWKAQGKFTNGRSFELAGDVTLIR